MFRGDEYKNEDWNCFGATVYSAGSGKIVALFNDMPDNRSFNPAELSTRPMVLYGNYVVIDHLNGEFSLLGHLKQASITVSIGEMLPQNHAIAQVGASGSAGCWPRHAISQLWARCGWLPPWPEPWMNDNEVSSTMARVIEPHKSLTTKLDNIPGFERFIVPIEEAGCQAQALWKLFTMGIICLDRRIGSSLSS
jgi:hypothetical protein